jgi:hypothetical protein
VVELARTEVALVLVTATPEAVDAAVEGVEAIRTAPDEALVFGAPGSGPELATAAGDRARAVDDDAVMLDATDGWAAWTLEGADARAALTYLSALHLPEGDGATQGEVAHVPAKIVTRGDSVHLLVPAMWEAHLRERVLADCAALGVTEAPEPHPWPALMKRRAPATKRAATKRAATKRPPKEDAPS